MKGHRKRAFRKSVLSQDTTDLPMMSGWIKKPNPHGLYQKRWFYTNNAYLNYAKAPESEIKGCINLRDVETVRLDSRFGDLTIVMRSGDENALKIVDARNASQWVQVLKARIEYYHRVSGNSADGGPNSGRNFASVLGSIGEDGEEEEDHDGAVIRAGGDDARKPSYYKEGWLWKKSASKWVGFQERYVRIHSDRISYFKQEGDESPQGAVALDSITFVRPYDDTPECVTFEIQVELTSGKRVFVFQSETPRAVQQWMSAIQEARDAVQREIDAGREAEIKAETDPRILRFDEAPAAEWPLIVHEDLAMYMDDTSDSVEQTLNAAVQAIEFLTDIAQTCEATHRAPARPDILALYVTQFHARFTQEVYILMEPAKLEALTQFELHQLIDWICSYHKTLRITCSNLTPDQRPSDTLIDEVPTLCNRYMNGEEGAQKLILHHCTVVMDKVAAGEVEVEQQLSEGDSSGVGTFYTHAPTDIWEAMNTHISLATKTSSDVLQALVVGGISKAVEDAVNRSAQIVHDDWQERGLEFCCAMANDVVTHIEETDGFAELFDNPAVRDKVNVLMASLTTALLNTGEQIIGKLVGFVLLDLSSTVPNLFGREWMEEGTDDMDVIVATLQDYIADFHGVLHMFWTKKTVSILVRHLVVEMVKAFSAKPTGSSRLTAAGPVKFTEDGIARFETELGALRDLATNYLSPNVTEDLLRVPTHLKDMLACPLDDFPDFVHALAGQCPGSEDSLLLAAEAVLMRRSDVTKKSVRSKLVAACDSRIAATRDLVKNMDIPPTSAAVVYAAVFEPRHTGIKSGLFDTMGIVRRYIGVTSAAVAPPGAAAAVPGEGNADGSGSDLDTMHRNAAEPASSSAAAAAFAEPGAGTHDTGGDDGARTGSGDGAADSEHDRDALLSDLLETAVNRPSIVEQEEDEQDALARLHRQTRPRGVSAAADPSLDGTVAGDAVLTLLETLHGKLEKQSRNHGFWQERWVCFTHQHEKVPRPHAHIVPANSKIDPRRGVLLHNYVLCWKKKPSDSSGSHVNLMDVMRLRIAVCDRPIVMQKSTGRLFLRQEAERFNADDVLFLPVSTSSADAVSSDQCQMPSADGAGSAVSSTKQLTARQFVFLLELQGGDVLRLRAESVDLFLEWMNGLRAIFGMQRQVTTDPAEVADAEPNGTISGGGGASGVRKILERDALDDLLARYTSDPPGGTSPASRDSSASASAATATTGRSPPLGARAAPSGTSPAATGGKIKLESGTAGFNPKSLLAAGSASGSSSGFLLNGAPPRHARPPPAPSTAAKASVTEGAVAPSNAGADGLAPLSAPSPRTRPPRPGMPSRGLSKGKSMRSFRVNSPTGSPRGLGGPTSPNAPASPFSRGPPSSSGSGSGDSASPRSPDGGRPGLVRQGSSRGSGRMGSGRGIVRQQSNIAMLREALDQSEEEAAAKATVNVPNPFVAARSMRQLRTMPSVDESAGDGDGDRDNGGDGEGERETADADDDDQSHTVNPLMQRAAKPKPESTASSRPSDSGSEESVKPVESRGSAARRKSVVGGASSRRKRAHYVIRSSAVQRTLVSSTSAARNDGSGGGGRGSTGADTTSSVGNNSIGGDESVAVASAPGVDTESTARSSESVSVADHDAPPAAAATTPDERHSIAPPAVGTGGDTEGHEQGQEHLEFSKSRHGTDDLHEDEPELNAPRPCCVLS